MREYACGNGGGGVGMVDEDVPLFHGIADLGLHGEFATEAEVQFLSRGVGLHRSVGTTKGEFLHHHLSEVLFGEDIGHDVAVHGVDDGFSHLVLHHYLALDDLVHAECPAVVLIGGENDGDGRGEIENGLAAVGVGKLRYRYQSLRGLHADVRAVADLKGVDVEAVELYKVVDIDVDGTLLLVDDGIGISCAVGIALAVDGECRHLGLHERQG